MLRVGLLLLVSAVACYAQQCGVPAIDPINTRVVGGYEAKPHSWPWQISLRLKGWFFSDEHWCGGSLINDQWIVTAAHCVDGREDINNWNIWLGAHDTKWREWDTIRTQPAVIVKHDGYNGQAITNDIALIKLPGKVTFSDEVSPVCLPSQTPTSGNGYVTGWGDMQTGGQSGVYPAKLQQVMTPVMDHNVCAQKMSPNQVDETMICAGFAAEEKGACSGDSGGPYVIKNSAGAWELAGIVSWGLFPCAQSGVPTVYTDAYHYLDWIQQKIAEN